MTEKQKNKLAIYQSESEAIELRADSQDETIWTTQKTVAQIFDVTPQNMVLSQTECIGTIFTKSSISSYSYAAIA